ncbi:MAG: hypothetical protein IT379_40255 [Deltaproteobacteria bacterium]|nr:hypothetical protein [Deltaproteobacteria bacterium]
MAFPNRLTLLVAGDEDVSALGVMLQLVETEMMLDRRVSAVPLRLEGERWSSWFPDERHADLAGFRRARMLERADDYEAQRPMLAELLGDSTFVGSYLIVEAAGAPPSSICAWTQGAQPSVLPITDEIAFVAQPKITGGDFGVLGQAPFDRVKEVLGDRLEMTGDWPPRFSVDFFPTTSELAAMKLVTRGTE